MDIGVFLDKDMHMMILCKIIVMAVVFFIGWVGITIFTKIIKKGLNRTAIDESVHVMVIRVVKILLWIILILTFLAQTGVKMGPIFGVLGTAIAAIALGLKDSLSNVAGGILLVFTKPFVKGDEVQINDTIGVVDFIDLFNTRMHTYSNQEIIIPNGMITTSMVINRSRRDIVRVDCTVKINRSSDVELAQELIRNLVRDKAELLNDPAPMIGINSQDEKEVVLDACAWCKTEDRWDMKYWLEETIKKVFYENGIKDPVPVMEIHMSK